MEKALLSLMYDSWFFTDNGFLVCIKEFTSDNNATVEIIKEQFRMQFEDVSAVYYINKRYIKLTYIDDWEVHTNVFDTVTMKMIHRSNNRELVDFKVDEIPIITIVDIIDGAVEKVITADFNIVDENYIHVVNSYESGENYYFEGLISEKPKDMWYSIIMNKYTGEIISKKHKTNNHELRLNRFNGKERKWGRKVIHTTHF